MSAGELCGILIFGIGALVVRSLVTSAAPVPSPLDPTYNASGPVFRGGGRWRSNTNGTWSQY
jgi:hypothetical protein